MKQKAPYSKMKIADRPKLAKTIILEGTKMNDTQNKKIAQVTDKTLVVGVDVGSDKHFARAILAINVCQVCFFFVWPQYEFSSGEGKGKRKGDIIPPGASESGFSE